MIVAMNLKGFPNEALQQYEIEALHPDEFVLRLMELDTDAVLDAAGTHRRSLKNPPKSIEESRAVAQPDDS